MRKLFRKTISLVLVIVLLLVCIAALTLGYAGIVLHTYQVFTQREPVAKVTISALKEDQYGKYADVTIQVIKAESTALTKGIFGDPSTKTTIAQPETFKIYGDSVYLSGPIVKFQDSLIWLNFKTMFKLGKVYGRYELDNEKELKRPKEAFSSFDLNGGFAEWKSIFDNYQAQGFLGDLFRSFIDTTQLSGAGQLISSREINYTIYITNNGFLWKLE